MYYACTKLLYRQLINLLRVIRFSELKYLQDKFKFQLNIDIHFFRREYLDLDIRLPQEKAEELSKVAVVHINAVLVELRRLLLAEDLVDSAKFFGILWVLTYVGALFNGLTLIIIGMVKITFFFLFLFLNFDKYCFLFRICCFIHFTEGL